MKKIKICFVTSCSPEYLGGYSLYYKNLIKALKKERNFEISWVYLGKLNRDYVEDNVKYFEIKTNSIKSFTWLGEALTLSRFFRENYFDLINSTISLRKAFYKKRADQRMIQTFHGTAYYFNKNHFSRFNFIEKILLSPILFFAWLRERPHEETDKIICVSEKVKRQVEELYGDDFKIKVIRAGVDLKDFKPRTKKSVRRDLMLEIDKIYGLYVGRGGFWTKGLDRTIEMGKELYKRNANFRLLIIGPDIDKVGGMVKEPFITFLRDISRKDMHLYYSASDIFFCMSRYEGGAPTLVVSEAMASGCFLVCSEDSEQEILEDKKNSIIVDDFGKKGMEKVLKFYGDKKTRENIIKNSIKTINKISLEKWGRDYLNILK